MTGRNRIISTAPRPTAPTLSSLGRPRCAGARQDRLAEPGLGLEGYRHQLPVIEQHPSFLPPENLVKYENMPMDAEQRALAMRGAWIDRHVSGATETFSKLVVTSADIDLLLRAIEADQSLVHAAYYTDDECIARIADWIAGRG